MSFPKKYLYLTLSVTFLFSVIPLCVLWKKIDRISKMERLIAKKQNSDLLRLSVITASLEKITAKVSKNTVLLPEKLERISCAKQLGIVKHVQTIDFESEFPPYNPSIIENEEGGYHLFFRYDEPKEIWKTTPFYSFIGYASLNSDFSPKKIIKKINTGSLFSEDPRIVKVGKQLFLSWNDKLDSKIYCRTIHSGKWNSNSCKLEYITNLDQQIRMVEKNWIPFERWEKNVPHLSFVYAIQPHKILDVPRPEKNEVTHLPSKGASALNNLKWSEEWGSLSGGTTARLIEGEYISFFHSCFREHDGTFWYVMGAYTFEGSPPYKITSITPYPILFPGIYESPLLNTADPAKRIIYPSGIAVEKIGNKHLLHVSCGENDCAVKIVTINYEKLRKFMVTP